MTNQNGTPKKKRSGFSEIWRRIKKNKAAMFGLAVIILFALISASANFITPYSAAVKQNAKVRLQGPSLEHIFGTDSYGRDVFARLIYGSRISLTLGFVTTLISVVLGGFLGAAAGFYGGKVDRIIMRICDMLMCIPGILLALAVVASLGPGMTNLMIAITISNVPGFVRLIRSCILSVVDQEFIEAARACATPDVRIIYKHIIPNAIGPIIVQATMSIAGMLLVASSLSFLGMGVQPPTPEWGAMLGEAREYMRTAGYLVLFPGLAIAFAALAFNLLGDGLRDALDPRLKS
jgi:peptide/nickel transport system permease protein